MDSPNTLLIYPPAAKTCEPPAGIMKLGGALAANGLRYLLVDANLEGMLHLLENSLAPSDTWGKRAWRNLQRNLSSLKDWRTFTNIDRYRRAVMDINRALEMTAAGPVHISLSDYHDDRLSPVRSVDLIRAAEHPEENPFYPYFSIRLPQLIEREEPSAVGLSLNYLSQALSACAMAGFLRHRYPGLTLVLGGGLVTSWLRNPDWKDPLRGLADYFVAGPGESPLLSILGRTPDVTTRYLPSHNGLPLRDYLSPGLVLPYSASTGCYWSKCAFCPERTEGNPYLQIPAATVIKDLIALREELGPALIHLTDNAISPSLLTALAANPPDTPWYGFARVSNHLTEPDFCKSLKRSGCVMVKLGLESGDQEVLDSMQKGHSVQSASLALKALKEAGIATYVYLLFGTPAETLTGARRTLDFVAAHHESIDFLNLALFNLPLRSPESAALETSSFYEGDLSLYRDFVHPGGWARRLVREFLDGEFRRHPAVQTIVRRTPLFFTSNHAPFLSLAGAIK